MTEQDHDYEAALEQFIVTQRDTHSMGYHNAEAVAFAITVAKKINEGPSAGMIDLGHSALLHLYGDGELSVTNADAAYIFQAMITQMIRELEEDTTNDAR